MKQTFTAYLALGSNVGSDAEQLCRLRLCLGMLQDKGAVRVTSRSRVYRSRAWGVSEQPDFLNAVSGVETSLSPTELLELAKATEQRLGRRPRQRWGPREIDIDLLLYDNQQVRLAQLTIPHPYLLERAFVVIPLLEIAPHAKLPSGEGIGQIVDVEAMKGQLEPIGEL